MKKFSVTKKDVPKYGEIPNEMIRRDEVDSLVESIATSDSEFMDLDHPVSPKTVRDAYSLFMKENKSPADIAIQLEVPVTVIRRWVTKGKWLARKETLAKELTRQVDAELQEYQAKQLLEVVKDDTELGQLLKDAVREQLQFLKENPGNNSMVLKRLSEVLANAANVTARAVQLEKPIVQNTGQQQASGTPLIILNAEPRAKTRKVEVEDYIDVVEVKETE
jgi:hypothetical protein